MASLSKQTFVNFAMSFSKIYKITLEVPNETLSKKYLGMSSEVGNSKNGALKYLKGKVWNKVKGWMKILISM